MVKEVDIGFIGWLKVRGEKEEELPTGQEVLSLGDKKPDQVKGSLQDRTESKLFKGTMKFFLLIKLITLIKLQSLHFLCCLFLFQGFGIRARVSLLGAGSL